MKRQQRSLQQRCRGRHGGGARSPESGGRPGGGGRRHGGRWRCAGGKLAGAAVRRCVGRASEEARPRSSPGLADEGPPKLLGGVGGVGRSMHPRVGRSVAEQGARPEPKKRRDTPQLHGQKRRTNKMPDGQRDRGHLSRDRAQDGRQQLGSHSRSIGLENPACLPDCLPLCCQGVHPWPAALSRLIPPLPRCPPARLPARPLPRPHPSTGARPGGDEGSAG